MTQTSAPTRPGSAAVRSAFFRPILLLVSGFLAVSAAMVAVLIDLSLAGTAVDVAVWIRCSLVLASSVILLLLAFSASRGSRAAWIRLRIVAPIVVVAVVVIVSIPGLLPEWVRLEQALCGVLVLPVAILANLPRARSLFPREA